MLGVGADPFNRPYGAHESYRQALTGLDITDVTFERLRERHPTFRFVHADISGPLPNVSQRFDIVLMIDVVQHIVSEAKLDGALENVRRLAAPGGRFIISGLRTGIPVRGLFNVRWWPESRVVERLQGFARLPGRPLPKPRSHSPRRLTNRPLTGDWAQAAGFGGPFRMSSVAGRVSAQVVLARRSSAGESGWGY